MKKSLLLIFLALPILFYGQKLKRSMENVKFITPPSDTNYVNKRYVTKFIDNNLSSDKEVISKTYLSGETYEVMPPAYINYVRYLNDFTRYKFDSLDYSTPGTSLSMVLINAAPIEELKSRKVETIDIKSEGKVTGQSNNYVLVFKVDKSLKLINQNELLIYQSDGSNQETFTFNYPKDFVTANGQRVNGFPSANTLEINLIKNYNTVVDQAKNKLMIAWIKTCYDEIDKTLNDTKGLYNFEMAYIKFGKKDGHEEFETANEKMNLIMDLIKTNYKSNENNWHTDEIQTLATDCEKIWNDALKFEKEDLNGGILDDEMTLWVTKNWLWTKFILGDFDTSISESKKLVDRAKSEKDVERLYMDSFLEMVKDYEKRYQINAKIKGWN